MKLNLETYIALVNTITERWYKITYNGDRPADTTCALCDISDICEGCPIKIFTRHGGCRQTPWYRHHQPDKDPENMLIFLLDLEESVTHVDGERL